MWGRIKALIVKEFLAVWKDKKTRFSLISAPILQLFVFSFAATLDVTNISIAVVNKDSGKISYELIQRFKGASSLFKNIIYLDSPDQIKDYIDTEKAIVAVQMDETFSRNLLAGQNAEMQLICDGRKSNSAQIVLGYMTKIIEQYNKDLLQDFNIRVKTVDIVQRNWFNPNLIYSWFTVSGLIALLSMISTLIVTSQSIARERELGTFEQLLVSPLQPIDILIGKTIPAIVVGMIGATVIILAAIFIFRVPLTGSLIALYPSCFIFICSIVGIGLFVSSLSKTQQQALLGIFIFMTPAVTLSGFATPIDNMPIFMQKLTLINPLRYFLVITRGVFLKELPFSEVLANTWPMAIIATFTLAVAAWSFKRRLE